MAAKKKATTTEKQVKTLTHDDAARKNIPTVEYQAMIEKEQADPLRVAYERRNKDLDPQLIWRGKDLQDWSDLVVHAPPLYIQEKVHPKVLIDDLKKMTADSAPKADELQMDLFGDFNGIPEGADKTEFYAHDQNWSNRMILGDSLQVMASLAEREALRGKVQCIYFDPPYGIKFNSNFQWSTTSRDVKDGKADHITREPEQVKAFRDTWRDGVHSYLTYLRDRLTVARELLTDSGSIFVQIGDENVHRVRALMDEVFGEENYLNLIAFAKTSAFTSTTLSSTYDYVVWYAKRKDSVKYQPPWKPRVERTQGGTYNSIELVVGKTRRLTAQEVRNECALPLGKRFRPDNIVSTGASEVGSAPIKFEGKEYLPSPGSHWKTSVEGVCRLSKANRVISNGRRLAYKRFEDDFPWMPFDNVWNDTIIGTFSDKIYVVQTPTLAIERCVIMATDPGDLVLDPTCGSGTTAYIAEQWGRRWITIDTSRVALALARARIMGARYPYYLLADSKEGQKKEAELTQTIPSSQPTYGNIRHGFVYERVPHITLKAIANNTEIDVIWEQYEERLSPLRGELSVACGLKTTLDEWEIPREAPSGWPPATEPLLAAFWRERIERQKAIDASIAAKADNEYLYDKPYEDNKTVRLAGPFTVESLSPHRVLGIDEDDELLNESQEAMAEYKEGQDFAAMIIDNLRTAGVQQAHKTDKIDFISLTGWPGTYICAEGRYTEGNKENGATKRAGIFIGPEFGTVSRPDLVVAAREAAESGFDVLVACAFNFEARTTDFNKLASIPVLKARMNADLHMAEDLKNTGKGNLFVIFGEPDVEVVSGLWLVAKNGRMVAHYDSVKELSGVGRLEEINRLGGTDLSGFKKLSANGRTSGASKCHQQNAGCTQAFAAIKTLKASDFPLSLTTSHKAQITINGVDVFHPSTGEVRSDGPEGIACWFIDTNYNEESFFVRHAYFLGQNDPYQALKTSLRAEINLEAWETLHSAVSRPFDKPQNGRIAVKVINHLGDEVMKVFRV
ncbi:MAG: site-specific DNA-methyltransferase [Kiritimatiellae bacterium]|nr:site-specific DNA-methyltransferase [Kiritimatiellia bacterium]